MNFDTAWLFWGLVFGSIGGGYFMYGKKQGSGVAMVCGLLLMSYTFLISSVWATIVVGLLLMAIPYFLRR